LLGLLIAWAAGATWLAFDGYRTVTSLRESQTETTRAYEEKVKALTRRLVGVASHQVLEQDGLEDRLTDLITRQVQLENRQAILIGLSEQAGLPVSTLSAPAEAGPGASVATMPATAGDRKAQAPELARPTPPQKAGESVLKLGAPSAHDHLGGSNAPAPAASKPASGSDPARPPVPLGPAGPPGVVSPTRPFSSTPLREQFGMIDLSIGRVERAQLHTLESLTRLSHGQAALMKAALGEVGLNLDRLLRGLPKEGTGGPLIPILKKGQSDPFDVGVQQVTRGLLLLSRVRPMVEAVPFRRPVEGEDNLTSNFGPRVDPFTGAAAMHAGMDFRAATGTPVRAAGAGRIVTADYSGGYGNLVEIDHGNGVATRYGHLSQISVVQGQSVAAGTVIGLIGSTGRSTGPHLHYETRTAGSAVNPIQYLNAGAKLFALTERKTTPTITTEAPTTEASDD